MPPLDTAIEEAEKTHRAMQAALGRSDDERIPDIIRLRSQFASQVAAIMETMRSDERLMANPQLAQDFEQRFFAVRQKLAQHQARWRMGAIEDDLGAYRQSVDELTRLQNDFYSWSKSALLKD